MAHILRHGGEQFINAVELFHPAHMFYKLHGAIAPVEISILVYHKRFNAAALIPKRRVRSDGHGGHVALAGRRQAP